MSRAARIRLHAIVATLLAIGATAILAVGSVLADSAGPPLPH